MDDKGQFLKLLSPVRRQLRLKRAILGAQYGFAIGAAVFVAVLLVARMVVFPYYHQAAYVCSGLVFIIAFLFFIRRLPGWKEAAALYNSYIPEDRVLSAHSFLGEDGAIQKLLIKETVSRMKMEQERVLSRKKKYPITKWFTVGILIAASAVSLEQFPTKNIETAVKRQSELEVVKKAEKAMAAQLKKEINPLSKKELEELMEELAKARTPEEALKAIDRKRKELVLKELKEKEKNATLEALANELEGAGLEKLASSLAEKDVDKALEEIKRLSNNGGKLSPAQSSAMKKLTGTDGRLSEEQLGSLRQKLEETFNSQDGLKELASLQYALTKQGQELKSEMAAKGLTGGEFAMGPQKNPPKGQAQSGNKQGTPPPETNGSTGTRPGSKPSNGGVPGNIPGSGNGNGNGTGTGQGTGQGEGTGSGAGQGKGTGIGQGGSPGAGAGLGQGSREFLTVPEKIGGNKTVESDFGELGEGGSSQFESDGPIQLGTLRPYEEVYGEYAASYRNSLDRVKLPGGLETIVKNYFSDLDPEKE
ncbi:hypothetical protein DRW41_03015 [Neobacillus piezotolerans]|uniref:Uncharacterized protein n=1 Tax=Neobacillus piezotolerans TaxID=2259171 RepID=A0A3D8GVR7_9BACI|nr:hypothetical protein [Neobacillus piezotolerans]RDU38547.1 hypothetical protein DRW41_03015 [Neobacillus piezotolerans]